MNKILLHAWTVEKRDNEYLLPNTHWIYLREIVQYYDEVILLSPCKILNYSAKTSSVSISIFKNVNVYELPLSSGYVGSIRYFFSYCHAYSKIKNITTYYARYPVPFGWLQKVFGKKAKRIIHYVGDPIDAAKNNPNFSKLKKTFLIAAFAPENWMYNWACKGAKVFTNGHHISERLAEKNIETTPLISSTLIDADFFFDKEKEINSRSVKFIYLGNLRTAKGVETILRAFKSFNTDYMDSSFTLVGSGEFEASLKGIVKREGIENVFFKGRIDDRAEINRLLRTNDVFLFGSLSEGSPRVVLEAIANGLAVISTPVGSLPSMFKDGVDILFADFNDSVGFYKKMKVLASDKKMFTDIRLRAYTKVKDYTIKSFLNKIFDDK